MKKIKFLFIAIALIAICSAFAPPQKQFFGKYGFLEKRVVYLEGQLRWVIIVKDIDWQTQGTEYDCNEFFTVCSFETYIDPNEGNWETDYRPYFFESDVDPLFYHNVWNVVNGEFIDLE